MLFININVKHGKHYHFSELLLTLDELVAEMVDEPLLLEVDVPPIATGMTGSAGITNGAVVDEIPTTDELLELDDEVVDDDEVVVAALTSRAAIAPRVTKDAVSAAAFSLKWLFMVQIFECLRKRHIPMRSTTRGVVGLMSCQLVVMFTMNDFLELKSPN